MLLSPSNLDHTVCPDLLLLIEARKNERTGFSLPVAQQRILFGRAQSMTLSVTDVAVFPAFLLRVITLGQMCKISIHFIIYSVSSVYFLTVEN